MSARGGVSRFGPRRVTAVLMALLAVSIVVSAAFGPAPISMPVAARIVAAHVASAFGATASLATGMGDDSIVWLIRMPRALLAAIVGATLAAVGVALQA
ncbi:iron chelate uptake ABC transporter family permease subunit, partial [Burkholderia sp. Tr-862]|uniref:iron chelate uptake ABC transporter family permease subunit n=1 Tax=Burkholderia sp. Tr-862 TaxID=2608331 RepID=UPI00141A46E9